MRAGQETFFMSCKSFRNFEIVAVQNQMSLEVTKNAVQKKLLTHPSMT